MRLVPADRPATAPRRPRLQWPVLLVLTLVWMMLWGQFSALTVLGGLIAGAVACWVFPLPQMRLNIRVRPFALMHLIVRFLADVIVASVQVSRVVLRRRPVRNAIVEVNLRTPSDFVLTMVAELTCLIPGSLVVEARSSTHTLFLHVLDVGDEAGVERFRSVVLAQEERVVRAFGADLGHLDDPDTSPGGAR